MAKLELNTDPAEDLLPVLSLIGAQQQRMSDILESLLGEVPADDECHPVPAGTVYEARDRAQRIYRHNAFLVDRLSVVLDKIGQT